MSAYEGSPAWLALQALPEETAMGLDPIRARGSLRLTLGRGNTEAEVDRFLEVLPATVQSLHTIAGHSGFAVRS